MPPFHLLSMRFKALIPSLGYRGVSAGVELTPRIDHVAEVNAEIDVMNWPAQRMLGARRDHEHGGAAAGSTEVGTGPD